MPGFPPPRRFGFGRYPLHRSYTRRVLGATARGGWWATKTTVRGGYRHRIRLTPLYIALALWIIAACLHQVSGGWKTALVPAIVAAAGIVIYARRRRMERRSVPAGHLRYLWACHAAGTGWLVAATAIAPWGGPMSGVLLVGALAAGVPWWWHWRIRDDEEPSEHLDPARAVWEDEVADPSGPLPGAMLDQFERGPNGWSGVAMLRGTRLTTEHVFAAVKPVAAIYDVSLPSVVVTAPPDGRMSRAHIAIYETNPLRPVQDWPGPVLDENGVVPIGVHPSGEQALYRFWRRDSGALHDLFSGCTESGKSRLVDLLLCEERVSPLVCSWVIDPQGGQSLPAWRHAVDRYATSPAEGRDLLLYAVEVMRCRNRHLANLHWTDDKGRDREGIDHFNPTVQMPLLSITVEEAQDVLRDPDAVKAAEALAGMARKCGLKLRLITQLPLLPQLGNSMYLRDQVAAGNVVVLRTSSGLTGQVAFHGALPGADPASLPREWPDGSTTAGLGYSLGASAHQAMMRAYKVGDPYDYAVTGETTHLDEASTPPERRSTPEPTPADTSETPAAPVAAMQTSPRPVTTRDAVLAYMRGTTGSVRTGTVAARCGISTSAASKTLSKLADAGQIHDLGHGEWTVLHIGQRSA